MIQAIFRFLLNAIGTVVQLICAIPNRIISTTMPILDLQIGQVSDTLSNVFDCIGWALGLVPDSIIATLIFIITIEIAKHTIFTSTHALIKVWNLFQKIKFW